MVLGEGSLEESLIGLVSGWELYTITEAMAVVIIIAMIIVVFGTICIGLGPVALT